MFIKQLKRLLFSWQSLVAELVGFAIVIGEVFTYNRYSAEGFPGPFMRMVGYATSGIGNTYFLLVPLMCGLAAGFLFMQDKSSNMAVLLTSRSSRKTYINSVLASTFLAGGIVGIFPLVCDGVYHFSRYGLNTTTHDPYLSVIDKLSWGYQLFNSHPLLFWLLMLTIDFIFCGLFANISVVASYFDIKKGVESIVPFGVVFLTMLGTELYVNYDTSIVNLMIPDLMENHTSQWFTIGYILLIELVIQVLTRVKYLGDDL